MVGSLGAVHNFTGFSIENITSADALEAFAQDSVGFLTTQVGVSQTEATELISIASQNPGGWQTSDGNENRVILTNLQSFFSKGDDGDLTIGTGDNYMLAARQAIGSGPSDVAATATPGAEDSALVTDEAETPAGEQTGDTQTASAPRGPMACLQSLTQKFQPILQFAQQAMSAFNMIKSFFA